MKAVACPSEAQTQVLGPLWLMVESWGASSRGLDWLPTETPTALQVCWKGFCRDLHVYRSRNCSARCSNHGVRGSKGWPATSPLG